MKKIVQGRYNLSCTKEEAIDRFREMTGYCRERISDDNSIAFSCSKKGEIVICDPPSRRATRDAATKLYGQITQEEDKTYLTYYTTFSKWESVMKVLFNVIYVVMGIFAILFALVNRESTITLLVGIGCFVFFVRQLYVNADEKSYAYQDSEIMIKVLEERVNAVNHWDQ